jgi:redox-sensitive bicupin YhaK (pirin superfamily)
VLSVDGVRFDLIAGEALGERSPVEVFSPLAYLVAELAPGQSFHWPRQYREQALYVVEGEVGIGGATVPSHRMAVLPDAERVLVSSSTGARIALLTGEPIGHRYLWWNLVSSRRERILEAAERWRAGGFERVPGDEEFIPLPEDRPFP